MRNVYYHSVCFYLEFSYERTQRSLLNVQFSSALMFIYLNFYLPELLPQIGLVFAPVLLGCIHPGNESWQKLFPVRPPDSKRT